jgi:hypothetical protein
MIGYDSERRDFKYWPRLTQMETTAVRVHMAILSMAFGPVPWTDDQIRSAARVAVVIKKAYGENP